jgi:hypothetical protein
MNKKFQMLAFVPDDPASQRAMPVTLTSRTRDHVSSLVVVVGGRDACVVVEDVQPAVIVDGMLDRGAHAVVVGHVDRRRRGAPAGGGDRRHRVRAVGDVGNENGRPLPREELGGDSVEPRSPSR